MVLGLAALTGLVVYAGLDPAWDSIRLVTLVLTGLAGVAALLMLLPGHVQRVFVSLLLVVHFGGIATAVMTVPPTPWLANVLWTHFYRPYLEFMYLNNAYHFYAPEPGPATLAWFYVKYDNGSTRWLEIPRRDAHTFVLQYQRRLSLTESINQLLAPPPVLDPELRLRRLAAGRVDGIPLHPDVPESFQYREPTPYSKRMLQTYARHVACSTPQENDPARKVTGVKIYRVLHRILNPQEMAQGGDPADQPLYLPYYQGEFDTAGHLKNPRDPYLYWLIPILKDGATDASSRTDLHQEARVCDFLQVHAEIPGRPDASDSVPFDGIPEPQ
jgi:hypothetical protein